MKVLFLSDPNSPHIMKWVKGLSERGVEITIFGLSVLNTRFYENIENVNIYAVGFLSSLQKKELGNISKLQYLKVLGKLRKIVKYFNPDIIHAHFATSYGLLCALTNFHPKIISVWGSDVYSFPRKSFLHKYMLKFNLSRVDKILSTSKDMALEVKKYTSKEIEITPFGIDLNHFKPENVKSIFNKDDIVIGNLKRLEEKYGLEYLIKAFKILVDKNSGLPLKLLIAGDGVEEEKLKNIVDDLNLNGKVMFTGEIDYDEIQNYQNMITVYAVTSLSESFGVSVLEANACEKPVVASSVGGLPEVVEDGKTGLLVNPKNPDDIARALEKLVLNKELRDQMGKAGRERVKRLYNFEMNIDQMFNIYKNIIAD